MQFTRWLVMVPLAAAAMCGSVCRADPSADAQTEATRVIARGFLHQLFTVQDSFGAYRRYATPDFVQHNPEMADGIAGREAFFRARASQSGGHPAKMVNVYSIVLVDKDLFAIHHHGFSGPDDKGRVFVDIWRVSSGRIVEHWDVIQPYPPTMLHANGMACGRGETYATAVALVSSPENPTCGLPDPKASRAASVRVVDQYTADVRTGDIRGAITRWFTNDYRQHSPNIADGREGAIVYLEREYGKAATASPKATATRTIAEGDYVLEHRQVLYPGATRLSTNVDIFRVRDGKVSEHWDVKQPVPDTSANRNGMW
ncbi:MAG TPA: nuclear transport factor 2 family protein [Steroidobacteraceae bacterium]|nr:nuclear transport factor 2 family protein [Steroidobacteraceae bacterium]HUO37012.1 nuclear transport factor 2 family protein [Mycobacterium sp.]